MILAVDVDYRKSEAKISGICFNNWADENSTQTYASIIYEIEEYDPGNFYRREMPCILHLLREHRLSPDLIVIDGFVYLGEESNAGLGLHLFNELEQKIPIVGVAKRPFKGTYANTEVLRGESLKPLFVTAVGIELNEAKNNILSMHGKHRVPTLLKEADRECRKS